MTRTTLSDDRRWFNQHPGAVVRFRRQRVDEFAAIHARGEEAPIFRPSFSRDEPLSWVAVVDLLQLLKDSATTAHGSRLRLRLKTIPIRGVQAHTQAKTELIKAVAKELLDQALLDDSLAAVAQAA